MDFLKKLLGQGTSSLSSGFYIFSVTCDRCGETIPGKVDLNYDLSLDDEGGYHVRKVLMGDGRCFQQVEVGLKFDETKNLIEKKINGGKFVE